MIDLKTKSAIIRILNANPEGFKPFELHIKVAEQGFTVGDSRDALSAMWDEGEVEMSSDRIVTLAKRL